MRGELSKIVGYEFENEDFVIEALTHASVADSRLQSNERMEFLGDTILGFVVSEYLFEAFPEFLEGELTKVKSAVVSRKTCAIVARELKLEEFLNLGKGMVGRQALPSSIAAAVLESIIAAIYLDGGIEPARKFVLEHMIPHIELAANSTHHSNFKSLLQQHAQRHLPSNPMYLLLDEKGPDHAKCFEVCAEIDGRRFASAWANSKKEAEQKAALNALEELQVVEVNDQGHADLVEQAN
jgi:ribonuclease-3